MPRSPVPKRTPVVEHWHKTRDILFFFFYLVAILVVFFSCPSLVLFWLIKVFLVIVSHRMSIYILVFGRHFAFYWNLLVNLVVWCQREFLICWPMLKSNESVEIQSHVYYKNAVMNLSNGVFIKCTLPKLNKRNFKSKYFSHNFNLPKMGRLIHCSNFFIDSYNVSFHSYLF